MRYLKKFFVAHWLKISLLILLFPAVAVLIHTEEYRSYIYKAFKGVESLDQGDVEDFLILTPGARLIDVKEDLRAQKALYFFSMGELASLRGNTAKAIENFVQVLEFDPKAAYVHTRLAEEYIKKSRFDEAKKHLKRALELDATILEGHMLLGNIYAAEKKYDDALKHYAIVVKGDPESEQTHILMSTVYAEKGDPVMALQTLKTFVKHNQTSFLGYYYLGRLYSDQKRQKIAATQYKKALQIHPSFHSAGLALGLYYETNNHAEKALTLYMDVIESGSDNPQLLKRALRLLMAKEDYPQVIKVLQELKAQDPHNLNNRVRIGLIYFEMENYEEAKAEFEELVESHPDSDRLHYYISAIYEKLGQDDKALESIKRISFRSKFYKDALRTQIVIMLKQDKFAEALEAVQTAIIRFPENKEYYNLLASVYDQEENFEKAIEILEGAVLKFPKNERLIYYLGVIHDKKGDYKKSIEVMNRLLKLNPNHPDALNFVGYTYVVHKMKMEEAEQMIRKALRLKPGYGYIEDSLGWVYYIKGDYEKSLALLEQAVKFRPDEAVIIDHLADVYLKLNRIEDAYLNFKKALTLKPDKETRVGIEEKLKKLSQHEIIKQRFPATDK